MDKNFGSYLDFKSVKLTKEETIFEVATNEKMLNPYKAIHGGLLYSLCDEACGYMAALSYKMPVTLNAFINYLKPALNTSKIRAVIHPIKEGKNIMVLNVDLYDEKEIYLANGTFTYMEIKK